MTLQPVRMSILALAVLTLAAPASANVVGVGTQNFNPVTDGLDYVTVHSSKTLKPGIFNFGGFFNYAVNSLPYVDTGVQSRTELNDTLSSSDFNLGVGILDRLSVGMSFPAVFGQTVERRTGVRGDFSATGNTELRFNAKYRFLGEDDGGMAAVITTNFQRTRNDPYAGNDPGPTLNFELVADKTFDNRIAGSFNLGYRSRNPGTTIAGSFIEPMRNQWIASAAASYLFESTDTKLIAEIFGAIPAQSQGTNPTRDMTSAEMLLGLKQDVTQELSVHLGAGTELVQGVSSPDWRVYTGLNYTFGPVWNKEEPIVRPIVSAEPLPMAAPKVEKFSVGNILFKFDSAEMIDDYPKILSGLVTELKRQNFKDLNIAGHTDSQGRLAYNNDLSLRRANAIRNYLIKTEGLDGSKITAEGFGPTRPIASNGNYQGRQANRRVEFTITR